MITIKMDTKNVVKMLTNIAEKQIPYAASVALNNTAFIVKDDEVKALDKHLDRPTPFTKRAYEVKKSTKQRLIATIQMRQKQGEYLKYQVLGGSQAPKGKSFGMPVEGGQPLNQYGNLKIKPRSLLKQKTTFSGTINGAPGIWRRLRGKANHGRVKLLVAYESKAKYKPILPFYEVAEDSVKANIEREFGKALAKALATAR